MGFVRCAPPPPPLSPTQQHSRLLFPTTTRPTATAKPSTTNPPSFHHQTSTAGATAGSPTRPTYFAIGWADEQGLRNEMEDSFAVVENFGEVVGDLYVGVYDGHGGKQTSDILRESLHSVVLKELIEAEERREEEEQEREERTGNCREGGQQQQWELTPVALRKAFLTADEEIRAEVPVSGATACVCLLLQDSKNVRHLHCAHVGDARAVLGRSDGSCQRLTAASDHKATDPAEMLSVRHRGGYVLNDRVLGSLAVSRAFGDAELKQPLSGGELYDAVSNVPDVAVVQLQQEPHLLPEERINNSVSSQQHRSDDRFLILACDGLWDVMTDEDAALFVLQMAAALLDTYPDMCAGEAAECLSRGLVEEALQRQTKDNITIIVVLLHPLGFPLRPVVLPS
eukprot:GHVS01081960.1.p1 GENE.GHVS01081960.1~~GHVS01081960.1.p1  ORF type:complete len:398 (+),score=100.07 GHVS01081960.1:126-1319(+)